jgi:hypothetical protein
MSVPRDKVSVTPIEIRLHKDIDAPLIDLYPLRIEGSDSRRPVLFGTSIQPCGYFTG